MQSFTIEKAESASKGNMMILTVAGNKVFYIGELIAFIIGKLSEGKKTAEITEMLNNDYVMDRQLSEHELQEVIDQRIRKLGIFDEKNEVLKATNSPLSGIRMQVTLSSFERIEPIIRWMRPLFNPRIFFTLLPLLAVFNIVFVYMLVARHNSAPPQPVSCTRDIYYFLFFYPCAISLLYLHELGHAAASYNFKVIPKNIGLGFYLIFPVLFTELNGIWKLSTAKKSVVNLGGIYVQMIINVLLIALVYSIADKKVTAMLGYLIQLNVLTMIANLNPFLKFDGYWIFSDLFKLPNLNQQSNYYFGLVLKKCFPFWNIKMNKNVESIINPRNVALILYAVLKYAFILFIIYSITKGAYYTFIHLFVIGKQVLWMKDYSLCSIEQLVKTTFFSYIITNFIYSLIRNNPYVKSHLLKSKNVLPEQQ